MAAIPRRISPLGQARSSRLELGRYLKLDGGRYLIAAAVILALMALLTLGQTGRLAAKGFDLSQMDRRQTELLREQGQLRLRITESQSLAKVQQRAKSLGLRPALPDQIEYLDLNGSGPPQRLVAPATPTPDGDTPQP